MSKATGTKEWSNHSVNIITGCEHNCKYCYAKSSFMRYPNYAGVSKKDKTPADWGIERLREKDLLKRRTKKDGVIMYPTSHDITPTHLPEHLMVMGRMLASGNRLLIVTKPHLECVEAICGAFEKYRDAILFRFTIGSQSDGHLKFWEPNAPSFEERLDCLKLAKRLGFRTSVSCEPLLTNQPKKLVEALLPYVTDSIWLGVMHMARQRLSANKELDAETEKWLVRVQGFCDKDRMADLYEKYRNHPKIRWKNTLKKMFGLDLNERDGMDV